MGKEDAHSRGHQAWERFWERFGQRRKNKGLSEQLDGYAGATQTPRRIWTATHFNCMSFSWVFRIHSLIAFPSSSTSWCATILQTVQSSVLVVKQAKALESTAHIVRGTCDTQDFQNNEKAWPDLRYKLRVEASR